MDYVNVEEAVDLPGLRLVLTAGVPGPWGEAAKAIFHVKGISYVPVRQKAGQEDEALLRWTRQTGAPAAMYERERPRSAWSEILLLAERLQPEPPLIPTDPWSRAVMFGICHEICGEQGFGWARRLMIFDSFMRGQPVDPSNPLAWKYGYSVEAGTAAVGRVRDVTGMLAARLHEQRRAGSDWLVGNQLSAADLYWATFAVMLKPLPPEQCPLPEWAQPLYDVSSHPSGLEFDPILLAHRDRVYCEYLPLPIDF